MFGKAFQTSAVLMGAALASLALVPQSGALSDSFETAPEADPFQVLGDRASGPGYRVETPVRSDGFMRIYSLTTPEGTVQLAGDGLLLARLRELAALNALQSLETHQSFLDGLKEAAQRPVDFVENTVTDPVGTAKNTMSGVGRLFGRISSGVKKAVSGEAGSPADLAASISGQAKARRELAVELGVDPYTRYGPLSARLDQAASVSTAGNWTVSAVLALVPGGMVVSAVSTAESLRNLIVDSTESELEERTAAVLSQLGAAPEAIAALKANPNYTPAERAVIAYQLNAMAGVDGRGVLVTHAANVTTRDEAYFQLRRIVMHLAYHEDIGKIALFRRVGGFPVAIRQDGAAALVFPLDLVSWTDTTSTAFTAMHEGLAKVGIVPPAIDFVVTGEMTPLTAERLSAFGWSLADSFELPDGPVE